MSPALHGTGGCASCREANEREREHSQHTHTQTKGHTSEDDLIRKWYFYVYRSLPVGRGAVDSGPAAVLAAVESVAVSAVARSCGCVVGSGWFVVRFVRVIRVPACARVSRVSRVCPGSPRCLFTGRARRLDVLMLALPRTDPRRHSWLEAGDAAQIAGRWLASHPSERLGLVCARLAPAPCSTRGPS